ncbi:hypothetical protein PanWU01x14_213180 [Parasponia andersonii]|uniref:Uncharacterized protein n=1 Tax=Parasponia andersonii TaxID=3476 RepID=A0A2P5BT13_PARAD|nr:hypothetical protein PanWU01x14_213180 [Parasponia andersonii]
MPMSQLRACSVCTCPMLRAHVLVKPSMGCTHVSHPNACLGIPPTLCARLVPLPCMLGITPAMPLLAANKPCHAPPKVWPCLGPCQPAHGFYSSLQRSHSIVIPNICS